MDQKRHFGVWPFPLQKLEKSNRRPKTPKVTLPEPFNLAPGTCLRVTADGEMVDVTAGEGLLFDTVDTYHLGVFLGKDVQFEPIRFESTGPCYVVLRAEEGRFELVVESIGGTRLLTKSVESDK